MLLSQCFCSCLSCLCIYEYIQEISLVGTVKLTFLDVAYVGNITIHKCTETLGNDIAYFTFPDSGAEFLHAAIISLRSQN